MKKLIRSYSIKEDIFEKILYDFEASVVAVDNFEDYIYGYSNKNKFMYDGKDTLILPEYVLNYYIDQFDCCTSWKQCQIRRAQNTDKVVDEEIHGYQAEKFMKKLLNSVYTDEEIDACLHAHEAEYDNSMKQFKYSYSGDIGKLYVYSNTYRYDINKAHTDALCEIFPKAKDKLLKLATSEKNKARNKKIANYYVGRLGKWQDKKKTIPGPYRKTYNWIVQRTTKLLFQAMDEVEGELLYANTDGFIVSDPQNLLTASSKIGAFKCEYHGPTYIYVDKNYTLYQTDVMKGSCLQEVRDKIDLSKRKVVHYTKKFGAYGVMASDIKEETLHEEDCYENL